MTDREKLVELINHVAEGHVVNLMQPGGAEALADHLIANGVTVQEWISVEDRLPEDDASYLVWASDCGESEVALYYGDGEWLTEDLENLTRFVTHWMPLPEHPKED